MKNWKIQIDLSVADSWVSDGFDAKERIEQIEELITTLLPHAYENEIIVKAKIISAPKEEVIDKLQGYTD